MFDLLLQSTVTKENTCALIWRNLRSRYSQPFIITRVFRVPQWDALHSVIKMKMLLTLGLTSVAAFFGGFFQRALHEDVRGTRSIEVTRLGSSIFGSPVYLCKTNETDCEFSRPYGVVTVLTLRHNTNWEAAQWTAIFMLSKSQKQLVVKYCSQCFMKRLSIHCVNMSFYFTNHIF